MPSALSRFNSSNAVLALPLAAADAIGEHDDVGARRRDTSFDPESCGRESLDRARPA